jgi:Spy/CpxP family protein refolding chaperone
MNKHLTKYLLLGILLLTVAATQAQSADSTMPHRDGMHRWGHNRGFNRPHVHYSPEQRQQMMAIDKEYRQKREDLFKQDNLTLKQYKAGLLTLEKEKKSKLSTLLTPEQKNELAANRKRMEENRQVREVAHLERLRIHLNLTDDQVAKIRAGNENLRSQARAVHGNDNLLPDQKREQLRSLMAKRNDIYKSVLTPDQYTEFEKMTSHRRAVGMPFRGSRSI